MKGNDLDNCTNPYDFMQKVHIDKDMNWHFDPSVKPENLFSVKKVIGKGGFGVVCHIVSRSTNQNFAGKVISKEAVEELGDESVQKEVRILKTLKSPNIIKYFGSIPWGDGSKMLLLEYCDKGSFRQILEFRQEVLTENQISIVMHDLAKAIETLHEKKIYHRDIKAANLLLNSKGEVKLCDFGVSQSDDESKAQSSMNVIGSPYWMAPEVISGKNYTEKADIWGIGITAVELAEGAPPYVEFQPTKAMIEISRNGFTGLRRPQEHSNIFTSFIITCLRTDPKDRPSIQQLLTHPFITHAETLNRKVEFANLMNLVLPDYNLIGSNEIGKISPPPSWIPSSFSSSVGKISSARDLNSPRKTPGASQNGFESSSLFSLPSSLPNFGSSNENPFASSNASGAINPFMSSTGAPGSGFMNSSFGQSSHKSFHQSQLLLESIPEQSDSVNMGQPDFNSAIQMGMDIPDQPAEPMDDRIETLLSITAPTAEEEKPVDTSDASHLFSPTRITRASSMSSKTQHGMYVHCNPPLDGSDSSHGHSHSQNENRSIPAPLKPRQGLSRRSGNIIRHSERIDPNVLQTQFERYLVESEQQTTPSEPSFHPDIFETLRSDSKQEEEKNELQYIDLENCGKTPTSMESLLL